MKRFLPVLGWLFLLFGTPIILNGQVNYTANDINEPYTGGFRAGVNPGYHGSNWSNTTLAALAAGNPAAGVPGVGVRALRGTLPEGIGLQYEYTTFTSNYDFFHGLGMEDNTVFVGFAADIHRDPTEYCDGIETDMFANLYEPIWDNGENGTPVNDNNYYALYLYNVMQAVGHRVKFWEIWNEPGFDFSGAKGWLPPGAPGNWWENEPDPCDYKLRAPVFHYIRTLRISYEIIKTLSPDDYVVMSGIGYNSFLDVILRNTDNPDEGKVTDEFPLKGGAYFDIAGFHAYPHIDGSTRYYDNDIQGFVYTRHSDAAIEGLLETQEERYQILKSYGYDGSPYPEKGWTITEINVPRQAFGQYFGSDELQINYLSKLIVASMQNGIHQTHIFDMAEKEDFEDQEDSFDAMGLYEKIEDQHPFEQVVTNGGISYKTTSDFLFKTTYDPVKTDAMNLPDDIGGGAFKQSNGEYIYTLWAKTATDQSEFASGSYSFPSSFGINNFDKKTWDFSHTNQSTTIARTNISLSGTPIFLTPNINTPTGVLTLNCPAGYTLDALSTQQEMGAVLEWEFPNATTTCPEGGVTIELVQGLPSGSLFPFGRTIVEYVATDACGNRQECAMTINAASTGGGIGDCHFYRAAFNWRGNFRGNKYFVSEFDTTYAAAVAIANSHGGFLVTISDQEENDYLMREVDEVAFIGLNDTEDEGSLKWPDGSPITYTNFDDCGFCPGNSPNRDFAVFHPWNGQWNWTNDDDNGERFFIMELPCSTFEGCTDLDNDGICVDADCDDNNPNVPNNPGTPCNDNNSNTENDQLQADGCTCSGTTIPPTNDCPTYTVSDGAITVTGFNSARTKIRLWNTDGSWEQVFECNFDCSDPTVISGLSGKYHLKIDAFDQDFSYICKVDEDLIFDEGSCVDEDNDGICASDDCDDNDPNLPATPGTDCDDNNINTNNDQIQSDGCSCAGTTVPSNNDCPVYTVNNGTITVSAFDTNRTKIRLWRTEGGWQQVFECNFDCNDPTEITNLSGNYHLKIDAFDNNYNYICKVDQDLVIGEGPCTDEDNDGICASQDCDDNNPNLPTIFGAACNDNNPNTINDQIQSDGCTCAGTPVIAECATITMTVDNLTITGSQPNQIIKVFDADWQFVFQCSGDCPNPVVINNISEQVYHIKVDQYDSDWNFVCKVREDLFPGEAANRRSSTAELFSTGLTLFPNPTLGTFRLGTQSLPASGGVVSIFNVTGQLVQERSVKDFSEQHFLDFDLRDNSTGLYYVMLRLSTGKILTERVVVDGR